MYLEKLYLKNVRSIKKAEIQFQKGINILSGDPGQGKSSIIEMIQVHLTNTCNSKFSDIKNWKAKEYLSDLTFYDNKIFNSNYSYKNSSYRKLSYDNINLENSNATSELQKYFDPDLIKASLFSFQGENNIHLLTPAKRRDLIKKIFNLNFENKIIIIENEIKETKEIILSLNSKKDILESKEYEFKRLLKLPFSNEEYKNKVVIEQDLLTIKNNYIPLLEKYNKKIEDKNNLLKQKDKNENDISNYHDKISDLKNKIDNTSKSLLYKELKKDLVKLENQLNSKDQDLKLKSLLKKKDLIIIKRFPSFDFDTYNNHQKKLIEIEVEIERIVKDIELRNQDKCPTCNSIFKANDKLTYLELKNKKDLEKKELLGIIEKLDKEKEEYELKVSQKEKLKNKLNLLNSQILNEENTISEKISSLNNQIQKEKINITEKENNYKKLLTEYKESNILYEDLIKELQLTNIELDKEILDLNNLKKPEEFTQQEELLQIQNEILNYDNISKDNDFKEKWNINKKAEEKKDILEIKKIEKELKENNKQNNIFKEALEFYRIKFPNYIIKHLVTSITDNMNLFMLECYDGKYHIDIQIDSKEKGIEVKYGDLNGKMVDTKNASGFEKSLLKLSWMIGLSMLSKKRLILLDEIDSASPLQYSEKLYRLIMKYAKNKFDQVILITHKEEIRDLLKNEYGAIEFYVDNGTIKQID